ncbi:MAG TPA: LLM class F420-dependent oxidoreductase [Dehalococcoidia bacterium]|nr:LLM class F420-dependent oxidoreductase [Dehalococcoidia bacterium]
MKFGIRMCPTDYAIDVVDLARAVEERGFESLWLPEHTHIPLDSEGPFAGGAVPDEYKHALDPFVALAAAAAATTTLKLGTGVCLVMERDPIELAKQVTSLDLLSRGRFLFGIGGGWNLAEMRNHGADPEHRWKLVRERVQAMRRIWTQDAAEFHGQYVNFDPIWSWPKPVQKPHPPVIVGGDAPGTLRRVLDYGDEWMPITPKPTERLAVRVAELQRLAAARGRAVLPVTAYWASPEPGDLAVYAAAGVSRCVFSVPAAPAAEVLPLLDGLAKRVLALA